MSGGDPLEMKKGTFKELILACILNYKNLGKIIEKSHKVTLINEEEFNNKIKENNNVNKINWSEEPKNKIDYFYPPRFLIVEVKI